LVSVSQIQLPQPTSNKKPKLNEKYLEAWPPSSYQNVKAKLNEKYLEAWPPSSYQNVKSKYTKIPLLGLFYLILQLLE
jgi:hypothetical protein